MKIYKTTIEQLNREIAMFQSLLRTCPAQQLQQVYSTLAGLRAEYIELLEKQLVYVTQRKVA